MSYGHTSTLGCERHHSYAAACAICVMHPARLHAAVLTWDQTEPFMNDTFDWPQWNALLVSDSGVIEYFQSMVILGDPVGQNM